MLLGLSLLLGLILLNGLFAMSEMAVVSSKRTRLKEMANQGRSGAERALALSDDPTRFLSTVQVGITSIGIISGAVGAATVSSELRAWLEGMPALAAYADALSFTIVLVALSYVSLVVGELAPKRFALTRPEEVASLVARPMQVLAKAVGPLVTVLSASTKGLLTLVGSRSHGEPPITPDQIKLLIAQAARQGTVELAEQEMVTNVLNLDERPVGAVLTTRSEVVFLDVRDTWERTRETLLKEPHTVLPICDGGLDHVLGFARATRVLERLLEGGEQAIDLPALADSPLFVPESTTLMALLEQFKRTRLPIALVVDEFGDVEGLVSLTDVVSSIVGDLPDEADEEPMIVKRDDGWLLDGALDLSTVSRTLGTRSLVEEGERQRYHTLGGLAMLALGRVPRTGDRFERREFTFEIVDMDEHRVDRVLVRPRSENGATTSEKAAPSKGR